MYGYSLSVKYVVVESEEMNLELHSRRTAISFHQTARESPPTYW